MYNRSKILALAVIVMLPFSFIVSQIIPQEVKVENPKFIISSWSFPDEYGQGIYGFFVGDNYTGVFLWNSGRWSGALTISDNDTVFESDSNVYLGLDVRVFLNYTLLGLTDPDDFDLGINYFKLNITVMCLHEIVFSQQNFTYDALGGKIETGIWWYSEEVIFDFIMQNGQIYEVNITYEVFY